MQTTVPTRYWHRLEDGRVQCDVCPRHCTLHEGQRGLCFVRARAGDQIVLTTYGRSSGFCIDPIEKKPLYHFLPGTPVLSFGTAGCNLTCKFCFPPETLVATTQGLRSIKDLFASCEEIVRSSEGRVGFPGSLEVWTRRGNRARVVKVFAHEYTGDLLSVKASGCPPIRLTPNHRVFAAHRLSPQNVILVEAADLTTDHYLVVPKRSTGPRALVDTRALLNALDNGVHTVHQRRVRTEVLVAALGAGAASHELGRWFGDHPAYVRKLRGQLASGTLVLCLPLDLLPTFFVHKPSPTQRIEGRTVSQSTTFIVKFKRDRFEGRPRAGTRHATWSDIGGSYLAPVRGMARVPYSGTVYNLEVDDPDHSYLAPFVAVSNCQNWSISKSREMDTLADEAAPEVIARTTEALGCRSVAFTYNDPVVFLEYAIDVAQACRERGIKSVAVTAGYICAEPRVEFYRSMDAANVDLKGFTERFYRDVSGGHLQAVLETLEYLQHETDVWFELTTLLIPGENDSDQEIDALSRWVVEHLGPDVPLHFTAFHPDWKMLDRPPTPPTTLTRARQIALGTGLRYVYTGNVHNPQGDSTWCPGCGELLIGRDWYRLDTWRLTPDARCPTCDRACPGVFEPRPGAWGRRRLPVQLSARP